MRSVNRKSRERGHPSPLTSLVLPIKGPGRSILREFSESLQRQGLTMPFPFGTRSSSSSSSSKPAPQLHDDGHARQERRLKPILTHGSSSNSAMPDRSITLVASPTISSSSASASASSSASALHYAVSTGSSASAPALTHVPTPTQAAESPGKHAGGRKGRRHGQGLSDRIDLPEFRDPTHLAETAISVLLTVPGPPLDYLRRDVLPKLYHEAYEHRVNCREHGLNEMVDMIARFRQRFSVSPLAGVPWMTTANPGLGGNTQQSVKVKFRSHLMDMDGSACVYYEAYSRSPGSQRSPPCPLKRVLTNQRRCSGTWGRGCAWFLQNDARRGGRTGVRHPGPPRHPQRQRQRPRPWPLSVVPSVFPPSPLERDRTDTGAGDQRRQDL